MASVSICCTCVTRSSNAPTSGHVAARVFRGTLGHLVKLQRAAIFVTPPYDYAWHYGPAAIPRPRRILMGIHPILTGVRFSFVVQGWTTDRKLTSKWSHRHPIRSGCPLRPSRSARMRAAICRASFGRRLGVMQSSMASIA